MKKSVLNGRILQTERLITNSNNGDNTNKDLFEPLGSSTSDAMSLIPSAIPCSIPQNPA